MTRRPLAVLAIAAGLPCAAHAQVIDIPPGDLPGESWFIDNPGATINVLDTGVILPDADGGTFSFNGATVNLEAIGASGWDTIDSFVEDVAYVVNGGELVRTKFVAELGTTTLDILDGSVRSGLWLQGNTIATMSGGTAGGVAGGQAAIIVEDEAAFMFSDGVIDTFIVIQDDATFDMTGGTIEGGLQLNDAVVATISGGRTGRDGFMSDVECVLNLSAGIIGRDFVVEHGTVNMSGGTMGENSGMLNSGGVDPVFTMTGGALGSDFRAYDGTINISGGLIGDGFRLGRPTGDGSGATLNLTVKSAMLDGVPLALSEDPTEIAVRDGAFLSCVLLDDSIVGLDLNEVAVPGEDRIRAGATLTVALGESCVADLDGDGELSLFDFLEFQNLFDGGDLAADFDGDGTLTLFDFLEFQNQFDAGCE
ncbi:MAG: GC-type dockerin domain-anchored protein [Phycisphaerales bacterium JB064]